MEAEETVLRTNYKPGRTVEELEREHLQSILRNTTYEERFKKLMQLIRVSQKMKNARLEILKTYKPI